MYTYNWITLSETNTLEINYTSVKKNYHWSKQEVQIKFSSQSHPIPQSTQSTDALICAQLFAMVDQGDYHLLVLVHGVPI